MLGLWLAVIQHIRILRERDLFVGRMTCMSQGQVETLSRVHAVAVAAVLCFQLSLLQYGWQRRAEVLLRSLAFVLSNS